MGFFSSDRQEPAPQPQNNLDMAAVENAKADERARDNRKKKSGTTILSGSQGLAGTAPIQKKTLLGE